MNQVNNFIHSIDLPALNTDTGDVYGILTAIPSPWVRAYMMKNALTVEYVTEFAKETGDLPGMDSLYGAMQDEYKGLLTCLALYGSRITTRKIELNYSDDLNYDDMSASSIFKELKNIYEIKGAFGNMLFCLLYTSPSPRDFEASRMPSSA